jgi:hypothetical protein
MSAQEKERAKATEKGDKRKKEIHKNLEMKG